jgi:hypothetical protein
LPYIFSHHKKELYTVLEEQIAQAQQALDELVSENLLPFKLCARNVELIGPGEYIVAFTIADYLQSMSRVVRVRVLRMLSGLPFWKEWKE